MKTKKIHLLALTALMTLLFGTNAALANSNEHDLPAETDAFWTIFAQMATPADTANCNTAVTSYVNSQQFGDTAEQQGMLQGMLGMCTEFALMPTQMQTEMAAEGVSSSLFTSSNWHSVTGLYFQKSNEGRISFSQPVDFMSYRFMNFMNNFGDVINFENGYISLNSAMVGDMSYYGAQLTMYNLPFTSQPELYVSVGSTMRKATAADVTGLTWNDVDKSLTFAPAHFSSFKAVATGTSLKPMRVSSVKKRQIKYNARKNSFQITVKGSNLRGASPTCMLGFNTAVRVRTAKNGKSATCQFLMSDFSTKGYYPLSYSISGRGEVVRSNAVKIK